MEHSTKSEQCEGIKKQKRAKKWGVRTKKHLKINQNNMNTITLTEIDGTVQTITSTTEFTTITGVDTTGATVTLFPVSVVAPVADPVAEIVTTTVGGVATTFVPKA